MSCPSIWKKLLPGKMFESSSRRRATDHSDKYADLSVSTRASPSGEESGYNPQPTASRVKEDRRPPALSIGGAVTEASPVDRQSNGSSSNASRKFFPKAVPGAIETESTGSETSEVPNGRSTDAASLNSVSRASGTQQDGNTSVLTVTFAKTAPPMDRMLAASFGSALKLIEEGLWIGDLACMLSMDWQRQDIGAIVTIMPSVPPEVTEVAQSSPGLQHLHYMLDDHIEYGDKERHNLSTLFSDRPHKNIFDVLEFMHEARLQGQGVMVHCEQGKRRSATVMAAYLIWYFNLSRKDSIQLIQARRPGATIPAIWRDELQVLAERRAAMDQELGGGMIEIERVISQPDLRVQLELDLKRKIRQQRTLQGSGAQPASSPAATPAAADSPDSTKPLSWDSGAGSPLIDVPHLPLETAGGDSPAAS